MRGSGNGYRNASSPQKRAPSYIPFRSTREPPATQRQSRDDDGVDEIPVPFPIENPKKMVPRCLAARPPIVFNEHAAQAEVNTNPRQPSRAPLLPSPPAAQQLRYPSSGPPDSSDPRWTSAIPDAQLYWNFKPDRPQFDCLSRQTPSELVVEASSSGRSTRAVLAADTATETEADRKRALVDYACDDYFETEIISEDNKVMIQTRQNPDAIDPEFIKEATENGYDVCLQYTNRSPADEESNSPKESFGDALAVESDVVPPENAPTPDSTIIPPDLNDSSQEPHSSSTKSSRSSAEMGNGDVDSSSKRIKMQNGSPKPKKERSFGLPRDVLKKGIAMLTIPKDHRKTQNDEKEFPRKPVDDFEEVSPKSVKSVVVMVDPPSPDKRTSSPKKEVVNGTEACEKGEKFCIRLSVIGKLGVDSVGSAVKKDCDNQIDTAFEDISPEGSIIAPEEQRRDEKGFGTPNKQFPGDLKDDIPKSDTFVLPNMEGMSMAQRFAVLKKMKEQKSSQKQSPPDSCCDIAAEPPVPRAPIRFDFQSDQTPSSSQIDLGPYQSLFSNPLPNKAKFIDSHTHLCFFLNKVADRNVYSYHDVKARYPEAFPPSYGGAVQVFCAPHLLTAFGEWRSRLVEGTEGELCFTVGCHPHFVHEWNGDLKVAMEERMQELRTADRLVALGECGLDFDNKNRCNDKKAVQREVFKQQLDMARQWNLPVVVHCRQDAADRECQAETECFEILKERLPHNWPIHRHCFRGEFPSVLPYLDYFPNAMLGFVPLDYTRQYVVGNTIRNIPLDRIVLETDAPYFCPTQMKNFPRSKTAASGVGLAVPGGLALATAQAIADIKNLPVELIVERTYENTKRLFRL